MLCYTCVRVYGTWRSIAEETLDRLARPSRAKSLPRRSRNHPLAVVGVHEVEASTAGCSLPGRPGKARPPDGIHRSIGRTHIKRRSRYVCARPRSSHDMLPAARTDRARQLPTSKPNHVARRG